MNRKGIIPLALASGFERVEKEYQFLPDTYEVSASDLELFVEKLTRKPEQEPVATVTGWYGGHPVIEPIDGWIPAVGTVLYTSPAIEPKQKPVAWMLMSDTHCHIMATEWKPEDSDEYKTVPLYTAPPTRKPLTDEEIDNLELPLNGCTMRELVRVVERAHGITND
jgi:hypothetical protein